MTGRQRVGLTVGAGLGGAALLGGGLLGAKYWRAHRPDVPEMPDMSKFAACMAEPVPVLPETMTHEERETLRLKVRTEIQRCFDDNVFSYKSFKGLIERIEGDRANIDWKGECDTEECRGVVHEAQAMQSAYTSGERCLDAQRAWIDFADDIAVGFKKIITGNAVAHGVMPEDTVQVDERTISDVDRLSWARYYTRLRSASCGTGEGVPGSSGGSNDENGGDTQWDDVRICVRLFYICLQMHVAATGNYSDDFKLLLNALLPVFRHVLKRHGCYLSCYLRRFLYRCNAFVSHEDDNGMVNFTYV